MKLSVLIAQREALLQRTRLANLAFAHRRLSDFASRIGHAQLRGFVTLKPVAPADGNYHASLLAMQGRQSVIDEHFADEDILELADLVSYLTETPGAELTFRLEEFADAFLEPLERELEEAGVLIDQEFDSVP